MMKVFWTKKYWLVVLVFGILAGGYFFSQNSNSVLQNIETGMVGKGDVVEVVSETGYVKAAQSVNLAFTQGGKVSEILTPTVGTLVVAGQALARLDADTANSNLVSATARLSAEQARLQELQTGADANSLAISESVLASAKVSLANAKQNLIAVTAQQDQLVANAEKNLRTASLQAYLVKGERENSDSSFSAPTISGTYSGTEEGVYTIELYNSEALSGSSFRISGLEGGVGSVSTVNPVPLGTRGLFIQFPENFPRRTKWEIPIPNTRSSSYLTNQNTYKAVVDARVVAISNAENAVRTAEATVAQSQASLDQVSGQTRSEKIEAQQALVKQMEAGVAVASSQLDNLTLTAPFTGIVTKVDLEVGQVVNAGTPVTALISSGQFELKVPISEVDIAEVSIGDEAVVKFDAYDDLQFKAQVTQIAPGAELVDGVRVFPVTLQFAENYEQIRDGFSADVDITTAKREGVISVPTRAIYQDATGKFVRTIDDSGKTTVVYIKTGLRGSDGNSEILEGLIGGEKIITFANSDDLKQLEK